MGYKQKYLSHCHMITAKVKGIIIGSMLLRAKLVHGSFKYLIYKFQFIVIETLNIAE